MADSVCRDERHPLRDVRAADPTEERPLRQLHGLAALDKAHDPACQEIRESAAEARARARWDDLDEELRLRHLARHGDEEKPWRIYMWAVAPIQPADIEDEEAA